MSNVDVVANKIKTKGAYTLSAGFSLWLNGEYVGWIFPEHCPAMRKPDEKRSWKAIVQDGTDANPKVQSIAIAGTKKKAIKAALENSTELTTALLSKI